jgi:hypothetical protein
MVAFNSGATAGKTGEHIKTRFLGLCSQIKNMCRRFIRLQKCAEGIDSRPTTDSSELLKGLGRSSCSKGQGLAAAASQRVNDM